MNETEKQFSNYFVTYYFYYYNGTTQFNGRSEFISVEKGIRAEKLGDLIISEIYKRASAKILQSEIERVGITSIQYLGDV
jgi:hypothetical protein